MYDSMGVSQICHKWNYYFALIVCFTILDYMFPKRLVRAILFRLINTNISCAFDYPGLLILISYDF